MHSARLHALHSACAPLLFLLFLLRHRRIQATVDVGRTGLQLLKQRTL